MSASPEIFLPRFEGPLDLLLSLVRKNEVEITDIPIAEITRQYLNYLHRAEELNIDLGADFVYIAALLIHIKSRSLLPTGPDTSHSEADPRQELIQQLLDHDQLRQGAEFLRQKLEIAGATWSKPPSEQLPEQSQDTLTDSPAFNLLQILRLAQQALDTARTYSLVTPADPVSVEEMTRWMSSRLAQTAGLSGRHGAVSRTAGRPTPDRPFFSDAGNGLVREDPTGSGRLFRAHRDHFRYGTLVP